MKRTVKIRMDGGNVSTVETEATTFGELKAQLTDVNFSNQKAIVRQTRVTLEDDEAHLPTTPFSLFLYPVKIKAGVDYTSMSHSELRQECNSRENVVSPHNNGTYGTTENMIALLEADDAKSTDPKTEINGILNNMNDSLAKLRKLVDQMDNEVIDHELVALEEDYADIKKRLGL